MGDWYDYFEDFPEENPANYVDGRFDPEGAARRSAQHEKLADEQAILDRTIASIIADGRRREEEQKLK